MASKYGNRKTIVDGILFDSKKEAIRYQELRLLERAGEITDLRCQVKFQLIPKQPGERACWYIADFVYLPVGSDEGEVVEDVKSPASKTPAYIIKRKLLLYVMGLKIKEV